MLGASTGTSMNTMNTRLITRAIASPSNRSRTIAMTSTRVTAADAPIATRPAISSSKLAGDPAQQGEAGVKRDPDRQDRLAPEAVGQRPPEDLPDAEAEEIGDHDQLAAIVVGDAQVGADRRQRRDHRVDRKGVERHQPGEQDDGFARPGTAASPRGEVASKAWRGCWPIARAPCNTRSVFSGGTASCCIVHHLENSRSQRMLWLLEEMGLPYRGQALRARPEDDARPARTARASIRSASRRCSTRTARSIAESGGDHRTSGRRRDGQVRRARRPPTAQRRFAHVPALCRGLADAALARLAGHRPPRPARPPGAQAVARRCSPTISHWLDAELSRRATGSPATSSAPPTS